MSLVTLAGPAYADELAAASAAQPVQEETDAGAREIVVVGTPQERYRIEDSSALTGFPVDFLEMPRVIDVLPEQLLLDRKITDLNEALRNSPGISFGDGFGGTVDDFFVRGFRNNAVYRNGFRRDLRFRTNLTTLDNIQVIKGPAAITYGQVEPGGLVDVVTKRPLDEFRLAGEVRYGSFEDRLFLLDYSQPLGDRAAIRIVGSTQDAESFRDFFDISRDSIYVAGRFDLADRTTLNASVEYTDQSVPLDRGTVTVLTPAGRQIVNNVLDIPFSRRFGEPFEVFSNEFWLIDASIEHRFGEDWSLVVGGAIETSKSNDLQARPGQVVILDAATPITDGFFGIPPNLVPRFVSPTFDEPDDRIFLSRRTDGSRERDEDVYFVNARLTGAFETGSIAHRIAVGADYREGTQSSFFIASPFTNGFPAALGGRGPLFELTNPVYGNLPSNVPADLTVADPSGVFTITQRENRTFEQNVLGAYVNDYINITDALGLLVGLRYDRNDQDGPGPIEAKDAFSPQVAVSYQFAPSIAGFASYSEAFIPNVAFNDETGATVAFDPEESEQIEVGLKGEFLDGLVRTSLAYFDIRKSNVFFVDNGVPSVRDGQTSSGVEFSVTGQPLPGMNIIAGYAYVDAAVGGGPNDGNRPFNVAQHTFNIWTSYEVQSGALEGLGMGAGLVYSSDRFGDDANSYSLGSFTLVDASLWYTIPFRAFHPDGTIRLQVAGKNLFDERFFSASGGNERIGLGTPRTVFGSVSFTL